MAVCLKYAVVSAVCRTVCPSTTALHHIQYSRSQDFLNIFKRKRKKVPLQQLHWLFQDLFLQNCALKLIGKKSQTRDSSKETTEEYKHDPN